MTAGDLTTLPHALAWLGLAADDTDGTVARLITSVSAKAQQWVSFQFATQSYDRTFDGRGTRGLTLPDRPITAISSLQVDGRTIPARAGRSPGFVFDAKRVLVDTVYQFTRGFQNVRVMYTAGYAATPTDVEEAVLVWIKATLDAKEFGANVSEYRAGDTQVKFSQATAVGGGFIAPMPVPTYQVLLPYQRVTPV
jgi:hypothetical protein